MMITDVRREKGKSEVRIRMHQREDGSVDLNLVDIMMTDDAFHWSMAAAISIEALSLLQEGIEEYLLDKKRKERE